MKTDDCCSSCGQKDRCGVMYEKLGKAAGPNVAWKAILAFIVPILVFIAALAGFDRLLSRYLEGAALVAAGFGLALGLTFLIVLLIRLIRRFIDRKHCSL